ncbi:branched-chain amino acid ABC transporter permease [Mesorhizobium sp. B3-2-1]|uniref:branched-chain amino acid ABC transporter permease n=1 Tax=Mesorhizobium sp. B3-2-1 TaxID=2589891 RepID=UPI00112CEDD6|nr:branched-chain amino acid ABC transporter permease [Mesorhizobium sp. B3-2-1]TPI28323.1 branched-chain amino acid ABC transporter permease [Mesorhizobium sp. B3-2-1]
MDLFLQTLLNGLLIGGVIATFTIGFQLAFGVLHVIDFAVGGWVVLGGYLGYYMAAGLGVDGFLAIPVAFVLFGTVGYLIGPILYNVRNSRTARPELMALALTFGLFTLLRGGMLTAWGFNTHSVPTALSGESLAVGPVTVPLIRVAAAVFAIAIAGSLFLFLYRTRYGLAIRATAENRQNAALMGVNIHRLSANVYGLYAGITAMAGVLMGAIFSVNPEVGLRYTLFAFFVAVLAGLGSVGGALVAALLLGVIEAFVATYVGSSYSLLAIFATLFLVLLVSPRGILRHGL